MVRYGVFNLVPPYSSCFSPLFRHVHHTFARLGQKCRRVTRVSPRPSESCPAPPLHLRRLALIPASLSWLPDLGTEKFVSEKGIEHRTLTLPAGCADDCATGARWARGRRTPATIEVQRGLERGRRCTSPHCLAGRGPRRHALRHHGHAQVYSRST